jgi:hypothetical protein
MDDGLQAIAGFLETSCGDQVSFSPVQKYFLTVFWATIDIAGDILFCVDQLFGEEATSLLEEGPVHIWVLRVVCIISIGVSIRLLKWRTSYMKEMGEVNYNLEDNEDVDLTLEEKPTLKLSDLEGQLDSVDSLSKACTEPETVPETETEKNLRAEIRLLKEEVVAVTSMKKKEVDNEKKKANLGKVQKLVGIEKFYARMTLAMEDLPQFGISIYVLFVTKTVTVVTVFSMAGSVVAAFLAFKRSLSLHAYHLMNSAQEQALRDLFKTLGGPNWKNHSGWQDEVTLDSPLSAWEGVEADGSGNVVALRLANNGLVGDFNDWVNKHSRFLRQLRFFDVRGNAKLENVGKSFGELVPGGVLDSSGNSLYLSADEARNDHFLKHLTQESLQTCIDKLKTMNPEAQLAQLFKDEAMFAIKGKIAVDYKAYLSRYGFREADEQRHIFNTSSDDNEVSDSNAAPDVKTGILVFDLLIIK